jgi:hypothetical protein
MARKLPPVETQFKKGQSGNPHGRIPNPALKALRKLTIESYREVIELVMTGNMAELKSIVEDPKSTALQVGIARAFFNAIKKGDYAIIERIAERIVGKIPDQINIKSENNTKIAATVSMFDKEKLKEAMAKLESDV